MENGIAIAFTLEASSLRSTCNDPVRCCASCQGGKTINSTTQPWCLQTTTVAGLETFPQWYNSGICILRITKSCGLTQHEETHASTVN